MAGLHFMVVNATQQDNIMQMFLEQKAILLQDTQKQEKEN